MALGRRLWRMTGAAWLLGLAACQHPPAPSCWEGVGERTFLLPTQVGTPLDIGMVKPCGPELVVSCGRVAPQQGAVCLCRAQPEGDRFRVFVHHRSEPAAGAVHFALRIRSLSSQPVNLLAGPNSLGLPARVPSAAWTGADPGAVGNLAWRVFLEARAARPEPVDLGTIAEQPYTLEATVEPGHAWSFIAEFETKSSDLKDGPAVEVAVYASRSGTDALNDAPDDAPMAAAQVDDPEASRGLFQFAERRILASATLDGRPHSLDLAGPRLGSPGATLPDEYERGPAANPGNHGVVYDVEIELHNPSPRAARGHLLMAMAGAPGAFSILRGADRQVESWSALQLFEAVRIADQEVPAGGEAPVRLTWALPGGVQGPQRLYVWPDTILPPD